MQDTIIDLLKDKIINNKDMTKKQIKILQVSIELFSKNGFSNTSTSQIAKKAEVGEGTIFKHFKNKENLLIATIIPLLKDEIFSEVAKDFEKHVLKAEFTNFYLFVENIVRDRIDFINKNNKIIKIFLECILFKEKTRKKFISLIPKETLDIFNNVLDVFKTKGVIVDWPNSVIMRFLVTNLISYGVFKYTIFPSDNWEDEKEISYITELLTKGLIIDKFQNTN